jgi:hypothetical protein
MGLPVLGSLSTQVFSPMLLLLLLLLITPAAAHEHNGIDYSKWKMPDTGRTQSCCNSIDCAPRPSRYKDGGWEVLYENRWIKVPDQKVETNYPDAWDPKDNLGHACISKSGNVYCFRPGEFLQ